MTKPKTEEYDSYLIAINDKQRKVLHDALDLYLEKFVEQIQDEEATDIAIFLSQVFDPVYGKLLKGDFVVDLTK